MGNEYPGRSPKRRLSGRERRRRRQRRRLIAGSVGVIAILLIVGLVFQNFFVKAKESVKQDVNQLVAGANKITVDENKGTTDPKSSIQPNATPKESAQIQTASNATTKAEGTIIIDAGHGGIDPGSMVNNIYEANVNLEIALKLQKVLEQKGYTVLMIRTEDVGVGLQKRVDFGNNNEADVYVSIHQNSLDNDTKTHGIETWYNSKADSNSTALAEAIQEEITAATGAKNRGTRDVTSLKLPREIMMPMCLIETGFLSSTTEFENLTSKQYQQKLADGIAAGIEKYLAQK